MRSPPQSFQVDVVGFVRSSLKDRRAAPMQADDDTPDAWIEIEPQYREALQGIAIGQQLVVITWLHHADRDVLRVHPGGDRSRPQAGVFATRSPARPNPLGLHPVTVRTVEATRLRVGPLEAIDGTPVVDIKRAL